MDSLSRGSVGGRVWNKIREQVGIDIVPHDLRRTAVTRRFLEDGWTPAEVQ
jgi:integrase